MPTRPPKPCARPGCVALTTSRLCPECQRAEERLRGSAASRGYGRNWTRARLAFLRQNPLCRICQTQGLLAPATVVDHIIPHRGDMRLFWDVSNWQSLCRPCHGRKTAQRQ